MAQALGKKEKRKWEDEQLSDLEFHAGWKIFKEIAESLEKSLYHECLVPAENEWETLEKEGKLRAIRQVRALLSIVSERAESFRRSITPS